MNSSVSAGEIDRAQREPVFILAPARSYTTVTLALLGGHPEIFAFPELMLFEAPDVRSLLNPSNPVFPDSYYTTRLSGLYRAISQVLDGAQDPASILRAEEWLARRADWTMTQVFDVLRERVSPLIALEKTPETVLADENLAACAESYPAARFIHLTRHPVDTQRSMMQHMRMLGRADGRSLVVTAASSWYLSHSRILRTLHGMPESRWIRVRAEDLLGAPEHDFPEIAEWLGVQCDPQVIERMKQTEKWIFAGAGKGRDLHGGDWKFMNEPTLRPVPEPGPVVFDDAWDMPVEMQSRMKALASRLGY